MLTSRSSGEARSDTDPLASSRLGRGSVLYGAVGNSRGRRGGNRRAAHWLMAAAAASLTMVLCLGWAVPRAAAATWWSPPLGNQPWQWELSHPLKLTSARDMGTKDKLPNRQPAPAPVIYDIDGIINPASTVSALHALGKHVVCYIEVGAAGDYYTAAQEGIPETYYAQLKNAGAFGEKYPAIPSTTSTSSWQQRSRSSSR